VDWQKGKQNVANYLTKHHPKQHHNQTRSIYLYDPENQSQNKFELLQGEEQKDTT
jgi:hypothetical protein